MAKQAGDLCTGVFDQRVVHECGRRGILERQLPLLRKHYAEKRDVMVAAFRRESGQSTDLADPRGGFFLWATLPDAIDADRLLDRAVRHGVVYVAGSAFFVNERGGSQIRLSFSAPAHDQIREGVRRLVEAIREELAGAGAGGAVSTSFHWPVSVPVNADITTASADWPNAGGMTSDSSSVI